MLPQVAMQSAIQEIANMHGNIAGQTKSSRTRRRILQATTQLYRDIGYNKTNVVDIAHSAAMSPANIYRFFRSKKDIEETVVAELLDEVFQAAANVARAGGSAIHRLGAVFRTIAQLHEGRRVNDRKLHELVAAAARANRPMVRHYIDRIAGLVAPIIAAGQARGEIRGGNSATLARCLLGAMDDHVIVREAGDAAARPTFNEMLDFCVDALCLPVSGQDVASCSELRRASLSQR
ncbi:Transcriptional regulatory protein [Bradyrhizobium sp. STM 3843]|uniref:TetR/AcrR family transcriptional regulator n=1 Tax=Bradyrhizobium sp. STM 3843 TaxID=551947 RepID=UPI0002403693|nr:TetR/AcrR family transcriptional regulator [Bradyrhizobium sp. STM 3843]CCE08408.1 Transcriptional regulatory protein [Bradyrhizobium sp. STM 3843]